LLLAAAARGIGFDGACCCKSLHRVEPFPKALGAPGGAVADMARGERAGQIALHGLPFWRAVSPSRGAVTCGCPASALGRWGSVRVVTTGWRRVVTTRLAQRVSAAGRWRACSSWTSAVAASVWPTGVGSAAGRRARQGCRLGQGGRLSCPKPDAYLQAFRLPGFRRWGRRLRPRERAWAMRWRASIGLTQPARNQTDRCCANIMRAATAVTVALVATQIPPPLATSNSPTLTALWWGADQAGKAGRSGSSRTLLSTPSMPRGYQEW